MTNQNTISRESDLSGQEYQWGFVTDVETDLAPKGLSEDIVRLISSKKDEPAWLLEWRLKAYRHWVQLSESEGEPDWAMIDYPSIDYQDIYFLPCTSYLLLRTYSINNTIFITSGHTSS